jgi:dipeptidyl-peptidase 4
MRTTMVVLLLLSAATAQAEDKFLREVAVTREYRLGRPIMAQPTPDGAAVLFLRSAPREPLNALYAFDVATGQTRALLTPAELLKGAEEKLSAAERAQRERQRISTRGFSHYQLSDDGKQILVGLSGRLYMVRRADGDISELATGDEPALNATLSPDGTKVAYVHDRDLYVYELATKKEKRLTTSTHPAIANGVAEFVAQEEMDRVDGFWWAPDGKSIAYEEVDNRAVEQFVIGDAAHPEQHPEPTFYPRPGHPNARVRVGVMALAGGATTWLGWDREHLPYLAKVVWRDQAPLTLKVMSRDQRTLQLLAADKSGRTRLLVEEHDDAWIDMDPSLPRWLPDGTAFLWSATVDGWTVLQLRGADGKLMRALSTAKENYRAAAHLDSARGMAWFEGSPQAPETQVFRVGLDGGGPERVTRELGHHFATFARRGGGGTWIELVTTPTSMMRALVHVADPGGDRVVGELPSTAVQPPFMSKEQLVRVGPEQLWASIARPRNFNPKKKYPVVVDVYAGPTHQMVHAAPSLLRQWMADRGVIVVAIDGRGTPGRGHDWERALAGDFSRTIDDQAAGVQALAQKFPEMDATRVGIAGWSFGGYAAALAVLKRGDVFHVAVAGAPVVDWRDYDTCYTERYLGLLPAGKPSYDVSSLLTYVPKLTRPLLIIHGTSDDNVYFFHSLKLAEALFRAGKVFELLPLPGLTHMVPDPVVKEQVETRRMKFLLDVLLAPKPPVKNAS